MLYATIYIGDKMKFKDIEDKSIDEIRYNNYTEGMHISIRKGTPNERKRIVASSSIMSLMIQKGKQKEVLDRLQLSKMREYSQREIIEEMLVLAEEPQEEKIEILNL